jgi:hypothetical protein
MPRAFSSRMTAPVSCAGARHVEPAFGGQLLPPLRHDAGGVRARLQRDVHHLARRRHLEVERLGSCAFSRAMSSSRMWRRSSRRCAVMPSAPASTRELRRRHRIGCLAAARVADGRDVIDVDAEAQAGRFRHAVTQI